MWLFCISTKSSGWAGTVVPWKTSTVGHVELSRENVLVDALTWVEPGTILEERNISYLAGYAGLFSCNLLLELLSPQDKVFRRKGREGVTRLYYEDAKTIQGSWG